MVSSHDFDEAAFSATKLMMKERFPVLVEKFTRNASLYVRRVDEAMRARDASKIVDNVHALKSSSAMLGFTGLSRCAAEIEDKASKGNTDMEEDIARLKECLRHAHQVLKPYVTRDV